MSHAMPPNLVPRVLDYLARLGRWMEESQAELETVEHLLEASDFDRLESQQRKRETWQEHFQREYNGLMAEWSRATEVTEAERAQVRQASNRVQALAATLAETYAQSVRLLEQQKTGHRKALESMRRGKTMMNRYRGADINGPGFVDRNA